VLFLLLELFFTMYWNRRSKIENWLLDTYLQAIWIEPQLQREKYFITNLLVVWRLCFQQIHSIYRRCIA